MMEGVARYWYWVKIDGFGNCRTVEVEAARRFFQEVVTAEKGDLAIQRQLVQRLQLGPGNSLAETCLRCFISHQIKIQCLILEGQFGRDRDFTAEELLPLVLAGVEESLTDRILSAFDPCKGNLSTWTKRMFKSDRAVRLFLLERGIEWVTDWLLLSQATPGTVDRCLSALNRTQIERDRAMQLLWQFHQVYRDPLRQNRQARNRQPYPQPTEVQLMEIAQLLSLPSSQAVFGELKTLAQLLRDDRLRRKSGRTATLPLENSTAISSEEGERTDFLKAYGQAFQDCLQQAVSDAIENRVTAYQQGKTTAKAQQKAKIKAQKFLLALHLFHCQGRGMGDIAKHLGLKDQPRASHLLELKSLRSDIARQTLSRLKDRVLQIAHFYADPNQLRVLAAKVQDILSEEVSTTIEEAATASHSSDPRSRQSQLARTICHYLDGRKP